MVVYPKEVKAAMLVPPHDGALIRTFNHVMIDLETMSLHKHKALILSVGLLEFDPTDNERLYLGDHQLLVPVIEPQLLLGRRVSADTQKFWAQKENAEAAKHWLEAPFHANLDETIDRVREFCAGKECVWANGIQFDLSNLEGLAEDVGDTTELWHYQAPNDMRTFCRRTPEIRPIQIGEALDIPGVPHEPVYDCISQAWRVWSHWSMS
jgi:hypothetical protein